MFDAMIVTSGRSKPRAREDLGGAKVKIAKYGATRQVKKMEANAVLRQMSAPEQVAQQAGLGVLSREVLVLEVVAAKVLVDDLPGLVLAPRLTSQRGDSGRP